MARTSLHRYPATSADASQKPALMEAHHADPTMASMYEDIRETLGLPFVNTDYRAFARWPSYFAPAWADLKGALTGPSYADAVEHVHRVAIDIVSGLPQASHRRPNGVRLPR